MRPPFHKQKCEIYTCHLYFIFLFFLTCIWMFKGKQKSKIAQYNVYIQGYNWILFVLYIWLIILWEAKIQNILDHFWLENEKYQYANFSHCYIFNYFIININVHIKDLCHPIQRVVGNPGADNIFFLCFAV